MLNALDHGWQGNWHGGSSIFGGVGVSGQTVVGTGHPLISDNLHRVSAAPCCVAVGDDSYLCEDGEVVINGQRYIWNPEVDGWVVVLDLPGKTVQ